MSQQSSSHDHSSTRDKKAQSLTDYSFLVASTSFDSSDDAQAAKPDATAVLEAQELHPSDGSRTGNLSGLALFKPSLSSGMPTKKGDGDWLTKRNVIFLIVLILIFICAVAVPLSIKSNSSSKSAADVYVGAANTDPATSTAALPSPTPRHHMKPKGSNPFDAFDIGNSLFDGSCEFYINTVKSLFNSSVPSNNINNNGVTSFRQYDCSIHSFPRCSEGNGAWGGDTNYVWNKQIVDDTDPYRYNTIWFMQLIADSDDLFHECDEDPLNFDITKIATTPLILKPDCITLGKWCRAWAGHVMQGKTIAIQGNDYSVEDAFLKLSSNRIKLDFKDETIYKSYMRTNMSLDDQIAISNQFSDVGTGNCITDQHFCFECNGDSNHCAAADGCLQYQQNDGLIFCP
ncbi:hypothetical protein BC830DRAFT_1146848 [Chytriomyces sp. MP71]|nr:hypothetical protein BC830DRAFT_1146848 [Chytriomyces sp. MP71]